MTENLKQRIADRIVRCRHADPGQAYVFAADFLHAVCEAGLVPNSGPPRPTPTPKPRPKEKPPKPVLKPCPNCKHGAAMVGNEWAECENEACILQGPSFDPDGAKWNALPRRFGGFIVPGMARMVAYRLSLSNAVACGDMYTSLKANPAFLLSMLDELIARREAEGDTA